MNTKKWLLALVLVSAGGCMDWSLDVPKEGPLAPVDCERFVGSAQRYPGICGVDGGADGGAEDGGADDGGDVDAQ